MTLKADIYNDNDDLCQEKKEEEEEEEEEGEFKNTSYNVEIPFTIDTNCGNYLILEPVCSN